MLLPKDSEFPNVVIQKRFAFENFHVNIYCVSLLGYIHQMHTMMKTCVVTSDNSLVDPIG